MFHFASKGGYYLSAGLYTRAASDRAYTVPSSTHCTCSRACSCWVCPARQELSCISSGPHHYPVRVCEVCVECVCGGVCVECEGVCVCGVCVCKECVWGCGVCEGYKS